jgi:hypothetical protein
MVMGPNSRIVIPTRNNPRPGLQEELGHVLTAWAAARDALAPVGMKEQKTAVGVFTDPDGGGGVTAMVCLTQGDIDELRRVLLR